MPLPAGAVEDEPLGMTCAADNHSVTQWQSVKDICGRLRGEVSLPAAPVSDAFYDAQFSPRNISLSVPIRRVVGSQ